MKPKAKYYIDCHIDRISNATLHTERDDGWYFLDHKNWIEDTFFSDSSKYRYYDTKSLLKAFRKSEADDAHVVEFLEQELKKDLYEEILSDED
jgi:hypothetical protein